MPTLDRRGFFARFRSPNPSPPFSPPSVDRPAVPLSITAGLEALSTPLTTAQAKHLLRRSGFGAPAEYVAALVGQDPGAAVDSLLERAMLAPLPPAPEWADEGYPDRELSEQERQAFFMNQNLWFDDMIAAWMGEMVNHPVREKLTLFWHGHFVTAREAYNLAAAGWQYLHRLRTNGFFYFKPFVHAVGLDPTMLVYLNGLQNQAGAPNENFARELLELFTMGPEDTDGSSNYSQQDVEELARALTGWVIDPYTLDPYFVAQRHDRGVKTIFGQSGHFGYDDVVDLIFSERAEPVARHLATKLYRFYVYEREDPALVEALAKVLLQNDFSIHATLRVLFKSQHFFDAAAIGARIKSPIELIVGMLRDLNLPAEPESLKLLWRYAAFLDQYLLNPPNVAGWPGYRAWLSTTTLPLRWLVAQVMIFGNRAVPGADAVALAEAVIAAMPGFYELEQQAQVYALSGGIADALFQTPFSNEDYERFYAVMLAGAPYYEWDLYNEGASGRLLGLLNHLCQLPEFQLT